MRPCPNPLIRIIIDDEDGELPSINISPHIDGEDYEGVAEEEAEELQHRHAETASEDEEGEERFGESLSSSVDSFIQHLDALHPYRSSSPLRACYYFLLWFPIPVPINPRLVTQ